MQSLFSFPNPANEHSARIVAAGVVAMCLVIVLFSQMWILIPLAYGFLARVLTGPTLSPLGQLATKVITPKLGLKPKLVPGPPKRFAQGIGATLSMSALLSWTVFDSVLTAKIFVFAILIAASFESFIGFCFGCAIFSILMKIGVIPESVCERCVN
ncbi:MAG: DUF4395 domain-containing protein [Acidimicrobiia bacterium]